MEFSLQQLELLAGKKITFKDICSQVDTKLNYTLQQNGALNIRVESLVRKFLDKEKLLLDREAKLSHLGNDLYWIFKDGIVRIVDKIIEFPYSFHGVGRIKNMSFVASKESGREVLRKAVVVGTFNPNASSSNSSHSGEMVDEIDTFISYNYDSMMKLSSLDINGIF
ncbi:unnamed protein product [Lactuca saligna]|uniref:Uncharacterized protein n=1 Tax=Lactuca saligna TaxID=75948 RepID=A0AA36EJF4_LACSI|nr:unnamed protein product [Lactuca saligna]